jgi:hypothetical protein
MPAPMDVQAAAANAAIIDESSDWNRVLYQEMPEILYL